MHRDEREGAARIDRNAPGVMELGAAAGTVEEAQGAAAGEGGGPSGGDLDTADARVVSALRCIMEGHTLREELNRRSGRAVWCRNTGAAPTPCARRVCRLRYGSEMAPCGGTGEADARRRARRCRSGRSRCPWGNGKMRCRRRRLYPGHGRRAWWSPRWRGRQCECSGCKCPAMHDGKTR